MIVWVNKNLTEFSTPWSIKSSRVLLIHNSTGKHGKCFKNVYLGYSRDGRIHRISIRPHLNKKPVVEKVVGIWVAECDYSVMGNEVFSGKTKGKQSIDGRFGIYETGTIIECQDIQWELKEDRGWVIKGKL